jgi:hypothetical protein
LSVFAVVFEENRQVIDNQGFIYSSKHLIFIPIKVILLSMSLLWAVSAFAQTPAKRPVAKDSPHWCEPSACA